MLIVVDLVHIESHLVGFSYVKWKFHSGGICSLHKQHEGGRRSVRDKQGTALVHTLCMLAINPILVYKLVVKHKQPCWLQRNFMYKFGS